MLSRLCRNAFAAICTVLLLVSAASAQDGTPIVMRLDDPAIGGSPYGYLAYLPPGYAANPTRTYTLWIFLEGAGETGNGTTQLIDDENHGLGRHGPMREIFHPAYSFFTSDPYAFDGGGPKDYPMIVVSPMAPPSGFDLNTLNIFVTNIAARYRVDPDRIVLSGMSSGGGYVENYVTFFASRLAGVVPMCSGATATAAGAQTYVGMNSWFVHAFNDPQIARSNSINWVNAIAGKILGTADTNVMATYPNGGSTTTAAATHYTAAFSSNGPWTWRAATNASPFLRQQGESVQPQDNSALNFTLYMDGGHGIWQDTCNNPKVLNWILSQRRQTPFTDTATFIPGTIQAENFDRGGPGRACNELTAGNQGNSAYRQVTLPQFVRDTGTNLMTYADASVDEAVDISTTGSITAVTMEAGEWLKYAADTALIGSYDLTFYVASSAGGTCHLEWKGANASGTVTIPNTGSLSVFQSVVVPSVTLAAGPSQFRLVADTGTFAIDRVDVAFLGARTHIIVDNADSNRVTVSGAFVVDSSTNPSTRYLPSPASGSYLTAPAGATAAATFRANLPVAGAYRLSSWFPGVVNGNARATAAPFQIVSPGGTTTTTLNILTSPRGQWVDRGVFTFAQGTLGAVTISSDNTANGIVNADAFRFSPVPSIATAAAATTTTVTGTGVALSVLGSYNGGDSGVSYTWTATPPSGGAATFSVNGSNSAKSTVATFTKAGIYTLTASLGFLDDATWPINSSSVIITVVPTYAALAVSPASNTVGIPGTATFTARAKDQFGIDLTTQPTIAWSSTGSGNPGTGAINASSGVYTVGTTAGSATITASSGGLSGTAALTITANAPSIASVTATPNPVTGTSTALSVSASDPAGASNLTYTWATTGTPPAAVTFSANGSNAAKNATATFTAAGSYTFQVTARNPSNLASTGAVTVTVNQTQTTTTITPVTATVQPNSTTTFSAIAVDQFGTTFTIAPTFTWSVPGTAGSISAAGALTAASATGGPFTVSALANGVTGTASATIANDAPTVATQPTTVLAASGVYADLSVLGADDGGEAALTYTWSAVSGPAATLSVNGSNAAKNTRATFTVIGSYIFHAVVQDTFGQNVTTSNVTVTVAPLATTVTVTPASVTLVTGATQTFTAATADQFGTALASQPAWSSSGFVTSSSNPTALGVFSVGAATSGTAIITATVVAGVTGTASGTASVTVDQAPTIVTAATATPTPVSGTFTDLSVLGADADGTEADLLYTWSTVGTPPAAVTFSRNASNAAQSARATFTRAGAYSLRATITDIYGLSVTSTVNVTVNQTHTATTVAPASANVVLNGTQQFSAIANDQFAQALAIAPTFAWTVNGGGSVTSSGLFTSSGVTGSFTVTATANGVAGTGAIGLGNTAPTLASPVAPSAPTVTGTFLDLTVLGADDGTEPNLTYSWSTTGTPPASVTFSVNGSNAAKAIRATFTTRGSYTLLATITDALGLSTSSSAVVTVTATFTTITLTPASATVQPNAAVAFVPWAGDQFGQALASQPSFTWSLPVGAGSVSGSGIYTATASIGSATVRATNGAITRDAVVTIANVAPTVATAAAASPSPVVGTYTDLSVLGADDGGAGALSYGWATVGTPPAAVTFSANGSNAAKNTRATFTKAGSYTLRATIADVFGLSVTSQIAVTVQPTLTTIALTPASASLALNATQSFSANAKDQFGAQLTGQPAFAWSASGGSISTTGVFIAGAIPGTFSVTAVASGVGGVAALNIGNSTPTLAVAAAANPTSVSGTFTTLSALGADDGGEAALSYTWTTTGTPPAAVAFSINGTNAAKTTLASFLSAGAYTFRVTINDVLGGTIVSDVVVTVTQTATSVNVTPATATLAPGDALTFTGSVRDQFTIALSTQPALTWSLPGTSIGAGTITSGGVLTASSTVGGPFTVQATAGALTGTAAFTLSSTQVAALTVTPADGTYASGTAISLATTTPGAEIRYTTDGSTPSASSTLYTGALTLSTGFTLNAVALRAGWTNSDVLSATYEVIADGVDGSGGGGSKGGGGLCGLGSGIGLIALFALLALRLHLWRRAQD